MAGDPQDIVQLSTAASPTQATPRSHSLPAAPATTPPSAPAGEARPFLRLWFACVNQYGRAYQTPDRSAYVGRCPKCAKSIRFAIAPGGTSERSFRVSC